MPVQNTAARLAAARASAGSVPLATLAAHQLSLDSGWKAVAAYLPGRVEAVRRVAPGDGAAGVAL